MKTEEGNKITVKVMKSSSQRYWYSKHVGQTFLVWEQLRNGSYILTPDNYKQPVRGMVDNLICPCDCEIISTPRN